MTGCSVQLFGGMSIVLGGEEQQQAVPGGKAKLLLAYLVLAFDRPLSRKQIAFEFWPDSSEKQALSNLRKLLHDLRERLPLIERYIKITPASIGWNDELPCESDVRRFEQATLGQTLHELRHAEVLYCGELLPGFFEEWLVAKRELLAQTYVNVLDKLVALLESQREYSAALFYANKLLTHNNLREESYRTLMRLHALNKDAAGAVSVYRQLQKTMQSELGIEPSEETVRLFQRLKLSGGDTLIETQRPLVGRMDEWGQLLSGWKKAQGGGNALFIVKGEAGIGKTRLVTEFKERLESEGVQAAFAGCYPSVKALSYSPVAAWLRSIPMPPLHPAQLSELSRLLPELSGRHPDLPKASPIEENWQLLRWYEAIERALADKEPLLLILDNMQWSDSETLQFLSYLLRKDAKAKRFVIATMRTDEYPGDAVEPFISGLRLEGMLTEIELAPLSKEETRSLMAASVGETLAERFSSDLYADTAGNPLFITETLREWQAGEGGEIRLSPMVKSVIENRLSKLMPAHRKLISVAAVAGKPVATAFLSMAAGVEEEALLDELDRLVQLKVLRETASGTYDFTHDVIRETAYSLMNESRRRRYHRQMAGLLPVFHRDRSEAVAAEIAHHYQLAGMDKEAVEYYQMAAAAAEKIYANETRIGYYNKLCLLLPPEQTLPVLMQLGDALIIAGHWSEAEKTYRRWLEQSGNEASLQERSACDVALGNCLRLQGKYEEAGFHLERALRFFELLDDHAGLSSVYVTLGILHYYMGDYDKVLDYQAKRAELRHAGDRSREDCRFFGVIGHLHYDQCDYGQAIYWIKKQIKLAAVNHDKYSIEQAMGVLAMVYMDTDEMDLAFDLLADKMEISKSIGDRMGFGIVFSMLGRYYQYLGRYDLAAPCFAFCLEEAVGIKDLRIVAIALSFEGSNLIAQRRLEEAEPLLERAVRLFSRLNTPYFACEALYYMSLLRHGRHQPERAAQIAEEALEIANRLKRKDMQVRLLIHLQQLRIETGGAPEAVALLQSMREQFSGDREQAAILYEIWKLNPELAEQKEAALMLNEALFRKSGKQQYIDRCRELSGVCHTSAARPLPPLAAEAVRDKTISPSLLETIDRYWSFG